MSAVLRGDPLIGAWPLHRHARGPVRGAPRGPQSGVGCAAQVKYVVELAKTMSHHPMVHRVDLLTRLIEDPAVDDSYGVEEECMHEGQGEFGGAYIIRVKAGDPSVYLPKESLWPHVRECAPLLCRADTRVGRHEQPATNSASMSAPRPQHPACPWHMRACTLEWGGTARDREDCNRKNQKVEQTGRIARCRFADYALQYIAGVQRRMHEASEPCNLYAVHGHYADAGEAAALIAHTLGCAMVLTGHSLGRNKLDHLKRQVRRRLHTRAVCCGGRELFASPRQAPGAPPLAIRCVL